MTTASDSFVKKSSKKQLSRQIKAKKIIASKELSLPFRNLREASKALSVPRTSLHRWTKQCPQPELAASMSAANAFFSSPEGQIWLHRIILAVGYVHQYGEEGVRGVQRFIQLAGLDQWTASATGSVHGWLNKLQNEIIAFGKYWREKLAPNMPRKLISIGEDENYHEGKPCLVAVEVLSNYILVEQLSETRTMEDWGLAVSKGLEGLNVKVLQCVGDSAKGIVAHAEKVLGVQHSPDLFHVQQEFSRATAVALKKQEEAMEKELENTRKLLKRAVGRRKKEQSEVIELQEREKLNELGVKMRKERRERIREARKNIGRYYHPVDLGTGRVLDAEEVAKRLKGAMSEIENGAKEAVLSPSSFKRIEKAKRMLEPMVSYLHFFYRALNQFIGGLGLELEEESWFREVLVPHSYLEIVSKKMQRKERVDLEPLLKQFEQRSMEGPSVRSERLAWLKEQARVAAGLFQRSSSCVEGRNGVLALKHHSLHEIREERLAAFTVVHNFDVRRADGTTAAERFFEQEHDELFEHLQKAVPMLGYPRPGRKGRGRQPKVA